MMRRRDRIRTVSADVPHYPTIHGFCGTRVYRAWHEMHRRCEDETRPGFQNYGGRGITVCDRWDTFENFYADMGEPPEGTSIDRIDNDLGYSPDNCRWATKKEQNRNQRTNRLLTFQGETLPLAAWAERVGLTAGMIYLRLKKGWSVERALSEPRQNRLLTYNGETLPVCEWAKRVKEKGVTYGMLIARLDHGWPIERVLNEPPDEAKRAIQKARWAKHHQKTEQ